MSKLEAKIILSGVDNASRPLGNTTRNAQKLAEQIKETKIKLSELNNAQTRMDGFTKLKEKIKETSQHFREAQNTAKQLAIQLSSTENPTKKLINQFAKAQKETNKLKDSFINQTKELRKQRAEWSKAGINSHHFAEHQSKLKKQIEQTNQSLDKQSAELNRINTYMKRAQTLRHNYDKGMQRNAMLGAVGYGALSTGRATAGRIQKLLSVGYEFDATMSQTQAVTRISDKNNPQMQALRHQARTLPLSSKFTDSEVAQGQYFLARTGYNPDQILKAMPAMLSLAAAGNMDLGTTADIASNIQTAMQIPAEQMERVSDVLAAAFTRNNVDIPSLGESLKYTAGLSKQFGQSLETITTATSLLGNAGIKGSEAGTSLRQILIRIGSSKAVANLGVKTTDKQGNLRDLGDIFKDIQNATSKMGNVKKGDIYNQISGQIGVTAFDQLMNSVGKGKFQTMRDNLTHSKGEAKKVADTMLDNLQGDMTMLHAAFENISVELFEKNNAWLRRGVQAFSEFLHKLGDFLKRHPAVSKGIVMLGAGLVVLTTVFGALSILLMSICGPMLMTRFALSRLGLSVGALSLKNDLLTKSFGKLGRALMNVATSPLSTFTTAITHLGHTFSYVGRLFMANPIGIVIMAIAVAALLIYKYWEPIKAFFTGLWQGFTRAIEPVKASFQPILKLFEPLAPIFSAIGAAISVVVGWFCNLFEPIKLTRNEFESAKSVGVQFGQAIAWAIQQPINLISGLIEKVTALIDFFQSIPEKLASLPEAIGRIFTGEGGISSIFSNLGANIVDGLMGGIESKWNDLKDTMSNLTDNVAGWFKSALGIHSPSRVFAEFGGFTVQGFQQGIEDNTRSALQTMNDLSNQITNTGVGGVAIDNRPSIISAANPRQSSEVMPQITITINAAPNMNAQDIANKVSQEVSRHLRTQQNSYRSSYRDID